MLLSHATSPKEYELDGDSILQKANNLMQRHRVFVAGAFRHTAASEAKAENDDLPVLTEVVTGITDESATPQAIEQAIADSRQIAPERVEALARELLFERLPTQRQALADELVSWLDHELPLVVMRVLDGITDQLVIQVTAEARAALLPRLQAALDTESQSSQDAVAD